MGDWFLNLPILWMALVVIAATYLIAACVYLVTVRLAVGDRARAFKAFSPGKLPPLGIIFGLLVGFVAVQVWNWPAMAHHSLTLASSGGTYSFTLNVTNNTNEIVEFNIQTSWFA